MLFVMFQLILKSDSLNCINFPPIQSSPPKLQFFQAALSPTYPVERAEHVLQESPLLPLVWHRRRRRDEQRQGKRPRKHVDLPLLFAALSFASLSERETVPVRDQRDGRGEKNYATAIQLVPGPSEKDFPRLHDSFLALGPIRTT